jgi:uncharacterized protein (DUF885 family)
MLAHEAELDAAYFAGLHLRGRVASINHFNGLHGEFAAEASGQGAARFATEEDYRDGLARMDGFARWCDDAIRALEAGRRTGFVQPRLVVDRMLGQIDALLATSADASPFLQPVVRFPSGVPATAHDTLRADYARRTVRVVYPAYTRLRDYLRRYAARYARATVGLGSVEGGLALYRFLARQHTSTAADLESIHAIGLAEVARIRDEIDHVRRDLGDRGSFDSFLQATRTDPSRRFADRESILAAFEQARARIEPSLARLFSRQPKAPYEIRAVPAFLEKTAAAAAYQPPTPDGARPGVFWVNTSNPTDRLNLQVVTTSLHEAAPGHHFQLALMLELPPLPAFRRFYMGTAYVEGWGLYAESLGVEAGLFDDPWQRIGHLSLDMMRACRLVLDTGIHAFGWSRERAIAYMLANAVLSEIEATAEVERYIAQPGQALGYKIGQLRIRDARRRAELELGDAFDVRRFHDEVLLDAAMPIEVLERKLERWTALGGPARTE